MSKPVLIGTWADASWAIEFYQRNGFTVVPATHKDSLLRRYWSIPERQIETSVVLADGRWMGCPTVTLRTSRRLYLLIVAVLFLLPLAGCHRWEHVGGDWYVRTTETLPEAGGRQPFLFRRSGVVKVPVLEFTYVSRYYGDDCLGFAARQGNYFACGERRPIELRVPGYPALHDLSFTPEGGKSRPLLDSVGPALVFPVGPLKARAMAQPKAASYDFGGAHETVEGIRSDSGLSQ